MNPPNPPNPKPMDVCVEPFLDELIAQGAGEGRLRFTESVAEGVRPSTVVFICVGTPPLFEESPR